MTELALLLRYELALRPPECQWQEWIDDHWDKISNGLAWFEARGEEFGERFELSQIALATFLGYLDFRFDDFAWREKYPALKAWHAQIAQRPSYRNTEASV